jgi:hypothetical protein
MVRLGNSSTCIGSGVKMTKTFISRWLWYRAKKGPTRRTSSVYNAMTWLLEGDGTRISAATISEKLYCKARFCWHYVYRMQ